MGCCGLRGGCFVPERPGRGKRLAHRRVVVRWDAFTVPIPILCLAARVHGRTGPRRRPLPLAPPSHRLTSTPRSGPYRQTPVPRIRQSRSSAHTTTPRRRPTCSDYAKRFHIPACTTANHCFQKLNQDAATPPLPIPHPPGRAGPDRVVRRNIEAARGVCQSCSIMLVEARSLSKFDLSLSSATAARAGATVVAAAWQIGPAGRHPVRGRLCVPHTIVVSATGDSGYSGLVFFSRRRLPGCSRSVERT